ncbi:2Fe-2S iron-sulfur cluster-binding protein [Streptomyces sp. NPDC090106]|uniref:2Fe-2S iron-sulfur cluster-binding protein n=1 Tax=Streptomyces sp. NPDC090106 TaxID=3365946 RepID=UPI00381C209A
MTDDQHGDGRPPGGSRWDPLPHGDYDDGATAFVKLPEGGIDALLAADSPLAAPGHGYVPPQITVAPGTETDPGAWGAPAEGTQWPDPNAGPRDAPDDRFTYQQGSTGQWAFDEVTEAAPAPGHDVTGQWSIPVAGGDAPDESGEFTTSALVEQWGGTPPATLPGGAAAPWAAPEGPPWSEAPQAEHAQQPVREHAHEHPRGDGPVAGASQPSPGPDEDPAAPEVSEDAQDAVEAADGATGPAAEDAPEQGAEQSARQEPEQADDEPAPALPGEEHALASYVLRVNGVDRPVTDAWIGESLLYVLRERLGLAGAKDGCSQGECGACNVQVDGRLVASCLVPAVTASGAEVRTVEGLAEDGRPSDVQRALARCGAVQCGFCVPGMAMTVHDLLEGNPAPTELETRQALCGNLCRCSGYRGVVDAVKEVVAEREAHAAADAESDGDEARIPHQAGPGGGGVNPSAFTPRHDQGHGPDGGQA